ncbi:aldose 1-epimerase [Klebsiella michiganensis]|nr:aldose 1-epimerase [Klebsiella michiganensis]
MAEEWILENAHLRMRVASLGGKVQSLYSRHYQAPVLYENPPAACFRCCRWPIASPGTALFFRDVR